MSSNSKIELDEVRWLVWLFLGLTFWLASGHARQGEFVVREPVRCSHCGSVVRIVLVLNVNCHALIEHSVPYLDSG